MKKLSILFLATCFAITCTASQKQFKAQESHEKTILISDYSESVCLQSETIAINAHNYGSYEYCITAERFDIIQGYNYTCSFRQLNYKSYSYSGREWRYFFTRNYYGNSKVTRVGIHNQREIISKVPLQRTGIIDSAKGTAYTETLYRKLKKAGYTIYYQNNRSSIHPKVDSVFCMVGRSILFVDNPLHRFSIN